MNYYDIEYAVRWRAEGQVSYSIIPTGRGFEGKDAAYLKLQWVENQPYVEFAEIIWRETPGWRVL